MFRCAALTLLALALLQTAPPDTEIFLAALSTASGRVSLGAPVNNTTDLRFAGLFFLIGGTVLVGANALSRSTRRTGSR